MRGPMKAKMKSKPHAPVTIKGLQAEVAAYQRALVGERAQLVACQYRLAQAGDNRDLGYWLEAFKACHEAIDISLKRCHKIVGDLTGDTRRLGGYARTLHVAAGKLAEAAAEKFAAAAARKSAETRQRRRRR